MSLAIQTDDITHVLLADGWLEVADQSFDIDSYEYKWHDELVHGGGWSGICDAGFVFTTPGKTKVAGPLTSILAVRCKA